MTALQGTVPDLPALRVAAFAASALAALGRALAEAALAGVAAAAGWLLGRRALRRRYLGALHRESRSLRGARVALNAVTLPPTVAGGAARGLAPQRAVLDVTVRPTGPRSGTATWRPRDLALVAPGAHAGRPEEDEQVGRIVAVEVWRRGRFRPLDPAAEGALAGPQRLRLSVVLRPGARRFHFRYFLELLRRAPAPAATPA